MKPLTQYVSHVFARSVDFAHSALQLLYLLMILQPALQQSSPRLARLAAKLPDAASQTYTELRDLSQPLESRPTSGMRRRAQTICGVDAISHAAMLPDLQFPSVPPRVRPAQCVKLHTIDFNYSFVHAIDNRCSLHSLHFLSG